MCNVQFRTSSCVDLMQAWVYLRNGRRPALHCTAGWPPAPPNSRPLQQVLRAKHPYHPIDMRPGIFGKPTCCSRVSWYSLYIGRLASCCTNFAVSLHRKWTSATHRRSVLRLHPVFFDEVVVSCVYQNIDINIQTVIIQFIFIKVPA